jgi:hypothetical protein
MIAALLLLIVPTLPAPYYDRHPLARPREALERSPTWDRDPVHVARFGTVPHATHEAQMKAQDLGRKAYEVYLAERRANRMPVVGQFQVSTSTTYSVSQAIPAAVPYAAPAPFYPSFIHGR